MKTEQENVSKSEIVSMIAENEAGLTKAMIEKIVNGVFSAIEKSVLDGKKVRIHNFGVFQPQSRKAREGVNPQTKAKIFIEAKTVTKFRPLGPLSDIK
jgi:nucleoid DNA-binding protein